ncbi:zinc finger protein [Macleaya cordata]|uniref:Zinc finger protein n=1 Tax=Macleaya cordata TaxID=56857 RepID=A0A200QA10_MACCD|nr:zinc finger protein [Macleaya cordata]
MLVEERTNNAGHAEFSPLVHCSKSASFVNGVSFGNGGADIDGSIGSFSVDGIRTYKRRKQMRMSSESNNSQDDVRVSVAAEDDQLVDQKVKQPNGKSISYEQNGVFKIDGPLPTQGSADCLHDHWRNVVLEYISQSLDVSEGGLRGCIRDALASSPFGSSNMFQLHSASEQTAHDQDSVSCHRDRKKDRRSVNSDGPLKEPNNQATVHVVSEMCQRVFHSVLVSEKFELLCKLLCENFQGIKVESFTEFSIINSRMIEGAYRPSPTLFHTDMQQVWRKFQKIGKEMVSLATGLSDMSRTSYLDQFGGVVNGICGEGKHEEINQTGSEQRHCSDVVTRKVCPSLESDQQTKPEHVEVFGLDKVCICRRCGAKADGKDYLVCDLCEEMYHVSCIEPAVEEIPPRSWYCANCTTTGIESPHENCVVCERLSYSRTQNLADGDGKGPIPEDTLCSLEEKSVSSMESEENGLQCSNRERILNRPCKLCGGDIEEGQKFKVCEHAYCLFRIYHVHCLTSEQLNYHGPHWYCPSCLCRSCLTDEEDIKIVLCDGCDHAYHIYCMEPPLTSIPKGKWFCKQCDKELQKIHKAKTTYEKKNREKKQRKNRVMGANKAVGGSVDMLLSAAEKLKTEEKLAADERKR